MTKLDLKLSIQDVYESYKGPLIFGCVLLLYWAVRSRIGQLDPPALPAMESVWLLIAISMLTFLGILALCWILLQKCLSEFGLPRFNGLVLNFELLDVWQQLKFYLALFALLLSAAIGSLMAIC